MLYENILKIIINKNEIILLFHITLSNTNYDIIAVKL